ncbi:hypothetical protein R1sor_010048 [Riccia sorocarpa]|uniref:phenylalanine--tRNA ligase n=1 Tax=Riccia sorocarpa TaxID=122646 RepID=A0ABD3HWV6_9MARC
MGIQDKETVEEIFLADVNSVGEILDSGEWALNHSIDHGVVCDVIKSLTGFELVSSKELSRESWVLEPEAEDYVQHGSAEMQVFQAVPPEGITLAELKAKVGEKVFSVGHKNAMSRKWIQMQKPLIVRKLDSVEDSVRNHLVTIQEGKELSPEVIKELKSRKLISRRLWKGYSVTKGPKFALKRRKPATDVTREILQNGSWKDQEYKEYNFDALGLPVEGGYLHPLLKVRAAFKKIFLGMGFEEMPTNNFVESSFWNFDALFQPQAHPARDSHDTFFLKTPAKTIELPEDYLQRVKTVHEVGGYESIGYGYNWKREEAEKNLLRTHTTAVSSRMLYKLAQEGFRPKRYFSIDRVFRNEAVDRTHLCEFHQIEGLICDRGLTLGDLIGVLYEFFGRLGMTKLRFKPAYNPYTEPSAEIFGYHEQLKKWVEIGNSGMFRPEMLLPMGLPPGVNVIAWGLSLERPTMILYGIDNIRELFGHKVAGCRDYQPKCHPDGEVDKQH